MLVDVFHCKIGLRRIGDEMQAGRPADRTACRHREFNRHILALERLHEIEIIGRNVDLLLLPERRVGAEIGGDHAHIGQELAQRLEGRLKIAFVAALEPVEAGEKGHA